MSDTYSYYRDLASEIEVPEDGILSRTLQDDSHTKTIAFGFSQGEGLSEHTSAMPALLYFVRGEADVTLGDDAVEAEAGTYITMAPRLEHSITARTPVVMLLVLIKSGA